MEAVWSKQLWASDGQCTELWEGPGVMETLLGTGMSTPGNRMPGAVGTKVSMPMLPGYSREKENT